MSEFSPRTVLGLSSDSLDCPWTLHGLRAEYVGESKDLEEHKAKRVEACWIKTCATGPLPSLVEDSEEDEQGHPCPEFVPEPDGPTEMASEVNFEGDRIFASGLIPLLSEIRATSTISQQLAEAHKLNSRPKGKPETSITPAKDIPSHL